jgi:hypothetical protein
MANMPIFHAAAKSGRGKRRVTIFGLIVFIVSCGLFFDYLMGVNCDFVYYSDQDICFIRIDDNVIVIEQTWKNRHDKSSTLSSVSHFGRYWQLTSWVEEGGILFNYYPPGSVKLEAFGHKIIYAKNTLLKVDDRTYPVATKWSKLSYALSPQAIAESPDGSGDGIIRIGGDQ